MRIRLAVAGGMAALMLAGCGSTPVAAPVTSTVMGPTSTAVSTVIKTVVPNPVTVTSPAVSTPPVETFTSVETSMVTTTAKATGMAAIPNDTLTCAQLSGIYQVLNTSYIDSFDKDYVTYTTDKFEAFGTAVGMTAQDLSISLQRLEDPQAKAAWEKAVKDGKAAGTAIGTGTGGELVDALTAFIGSSAAAMGVCTSVMTGG